jgi:hypothetical protein
MIDLRDIRDGLPANETAAVTSADLAEQRENLMQQTEEGVPRDVRPIPADREPHNVDQRSIDQSAELRNSLQPNGPLTNERSDVTIETSATPDANSGARSDSFEAQRERQATNNAADRNEEAATETLALFSEFEINDLRSRWSTVQAGFVDAPRRSVEQADQLVAAVMQRLADGFAEERTTLERQWDRGDSISTEDLRVALQRYRVFFGRLLNAA